MADPTEPPAPSQDDLDDHAADALFRLSQELYARQRTNEYHTNLFSQGPKWGMSPPEMLGPHGGAAQIMKPQGTRLDADLHTHPASDRGDKVQYLTDSFSPSDTRSIRALTALQKHEIIGYILNQAGAGFGDVLRYRPGTTPVDKIGVAKGEPVLHRFPIEAMKESIAKRILESRTMHPAMKARLLKTLMVPPQTSN